MHAFRPMTHAAQESFQSARKRGYRGRTWATRGASVIDRVASAVVDRRFIDPRAKFRWLKKPRLPETRWASILTARSSRTLARG